MKKDIEEEESEPEVQDMSAFNLALPYLNRINELLSLSSHYFIMKKLDSLARVLKAIFIEVSPKLSNKERIEFTKRLNEALKSRRIWVIAKSKGDNLTFLEKMDNVNYKKMASVNYKKYEDLLEGLDIWLRDRLEAQGMLIPSAKDPRFMQGIR